MAQKRNTSQEMQDVEIKIGKIMRVGVLIAVVIMLIGFILLLIKGTGGYPNNGFPTRLNAICFGVLQLKPYAYMMLGILVLILTPVLRVVISIYAFYKEKDYLYVRITSIVLIILIISLIIGHAK